MKRENRNIWNKLIPEGHGFHALSEWFERQNIRTDR